MTAEKACCLSKVADQTFLSDAVADPMERANLKDREPQVPRALAAAWTEWDKTMLPLEPKSLTHGITAEDLADHFGVVD